MSLIAVIAVIALILSACGGGRNAQDRAEPETPAQQQGPAQPPADPAQETADMPAQEADAPQEGPEGPAEEPAGPEIKAPEMVEITMDNWQEYLEIVTFDAEDQTFGTKTMNWALAVREEYSEQFRENGVYDYQERRKTPVLRYGDISRTNIC